MKCGSVFLFSMDTQKKGDGMLSKDSADSCINKWSGDVLIEDLIEEFRRRYPLPDDEIPSLEVLGFFKQMLASEETTP